MLNSLSFGILASHVTSIKIQIDCNNVYYLQKSFQNKNSISLLTFLFRFLFKKCKKLFKTPAIRGEKSYYKNGMWFKNLNDEI